MVLFYFPCIINIVPLLLFNYISNAYSFRITLIFCHQGNYMWCRNVFILLPSYWSIVNSSRKKEIGQEKGKYSVIQFSSCKNIYERNGFSVLIIDVMYSALKALQQIWHSFCTKAKYVFGALYIVDIWQYLYIESLRFIIDQMNSLDPYYIAMIEEVRNDVVTNQIIGLRVEIERSLSVGKAKISSTRITRKENTKQIFEKHLMITAQRNKYWQNERIQLIISKYK